jgi:hypothetical protein
MNMKNEEHVINGLNNCIKDPIIMRVRACETVAVCMFIVEAQQQKTA